MVAVKAHQAQAFLNAPDPNIRAVLFFGSDAGLVGERAQMLAKAAAQRFDPPGELIRLDDADLDGDPDRLAVELNTVPMFGGPKIIRYGPEPARDGGAAEAARRGRRARRRADRRRRQSRSPTRALRTLFEKSPVAAAIACYADAAAGSRRRSCATSCGRRRHDLIRMPARRWWSGLARTGRCRAARSRSFVLYVGRAAASMWPRWKPSSATYRNSRWSGSRTRRRRGRRPRRWRNAGGPFQPVRARRPSSPPRSAISSGCTGCGRARSGQLHGGCAPADAPAAAFQAKGRVRRSVPLVDRAAARRGSGENIDGRQSGARSRGRSKTALSERLMMGLAMMVSARSEARR